MTKEQILASLESDYEEGRWYRYPFEKEDLKTIIEAMKKDIASVRCKDCAHRVRGTGGISFCGLDNYPGPEDGCTRGVKKHDQV